MEVVTGPIRIKDIFLDNANWWTFYSQHQDKIRDAIVENVAKFLACRTKLMGYHQFECPNCHCILIVCHTCKSRFCSSCGKKATDEWIKKNTTILPKTWWQHITFTMPDVLWELFWLNRHLFTLLPPIAANIIMELAHQQNFIPGMFVALHTFSRDLSHNVHLHLSTTVGGLSLDHQRWIKKKDVYFYHDSVKKMWRHRVVKLFREQFKAGTLKLPSSLGFIRDMTDFNRWTGMLYDKKWVAFLGKPTIDHKRTIEYLGKYLKRPPISETRIKKYDGKNVTFLYLDHYSKTYQTFTLPVFDFIGRLISHIPDKHFRCLRYYGWLSNRTRGELLPLAYKLLKKPMPVIESTVIHWRELFIKTFGRDPLACPKCKTIMALTAWIFAKSGFKWFELHQGLALKNHTI